MEAYIVDWLNLLVRWLHLITGIAWIGASFYFVMLDNSLSPPKKPEDAKRGVFGELWAVHGGGFYNSQKYLIGPKGEPLSENLHWSKWEAYTTWLSGMGLLAIIYWYGASSYLIDPAVRTLSPPVAVAISIAFIAGGWLVYDGLCRVLAGNENILAGAMLALVMASAWALFHVFGARAAFVHVGAMIGTMMVANVFFHIIPGQKRMVADIRAGREPDPTPGIIGKQRSVHNTYFTLPVLFVMISNHYPMTYSHPLRLARARRHHAGGRADPAIFRAAPQRTHDVDAAGCRGCAPRRFGRCPRASAGPARGQGGSRRVLARESGHRRAMRSVPCRPADTGRIRPAAEGRRAGDPGTDRAECGEDRRDRRQSLHADRQPDTDDRRGARTHRGMGRAGRKALSARRCRLRCRTAR